MLDLSSDTVTAYTERFMEALAANKSAPLDFEKFLKSTFVPAEKTSGRKYPYTVNIPKSVPELLQGDFSPQYSFVVEKPLMYKDIPIWFGDSSKGVYTRFGAENGDIRYPCTNQLGDVTIHGMLGGATGQGKSVANNAFIAAMLAEYAPWEVRLALADAKIAEFSYYMYDAPFPHIISIAATEDTDYILSQLHSLRQEMSRWNSIFAKAGTDKIESFRKATGLCVPRTLIIIDEFVAMLKNAEKEGSSKLKAVNELLDAFARLGRSTGFHFMMSSQEFNGALDKGILGNISLRSCLGVNDPGISQMILGNPGALANFNRKGRLLVNTSPGEGRVSDNKLFVVPLIDKKEHTVGLSQISQKYATEFKFSRPTSFYDQTSVLYEKDFPAYLKKSDASVDWLPLGEPSFVTTDYPKGFGIKWDWNSITNLCITSSSTEAKIRFCKMLKMYFQYLKQQGCDIVHSVACCDEAIREACRFEELTPYIDTGTNFTDNTELRMSLYAIRNRRFALEVDKLVFTASRTSEESEQYFQQNFSDQPELNTAVNHSRCYYALQLLKTTFAAEYGTDTMKEAEKDYNTSVAMRSLFENAKKTNCLDSKMTADKFSIYYSWIIAPETMIGLGMGMGASRNKNALVEKMQIAKSYRVRFITVITNFTDVTELVNGIRYFLTEGLPQPVVSKIKCEDFPTVIPNVAGVLYEKGAPVDTVNLVSSCHKFKKMFLEGETL